MGAKYRVQNSYAVKTFSPFQFISVVATRLGIPEPEATARVSELAKYLAVVAAARQANERTLFSPPEVLDAVWQIWLEPDFRADYDKFCDYALGYRVERRQMPVQPLGELFGKIAEELGLDLDGEYWQAKSGSQLGLLFPHTGGDF